MSFRKRIMFSESIFKLHSSTFVSVHSCRVMLMPPINRHIARCMHMLWVCGFLIVALLGVCV